MDAEVMNDGRVDRLRRAPRAGGFSARDIEMYVHGFARGDEGMARAILAGLRAGVERGSVRGVARRCGVSEASVRVWVRKVREGMHALRVVGGRRSWGVGVGESEE